MEPTEPGATAPCAGSTAECHSTVPTSPTRLTPHRGITCISESCWAFTRDTWPAGGAALGVAQEGTGPWLEADGGSLEPHSLLRNCSGNPGQQQAEAWDTVGLTSGSGAVPCGLVWALQPPGPMWAQPCAQAGRRASGTGLSRLSPGRERLGTEEAHQEIRSCAPTSALHPHPTQVLGPFPPHTLPQNPNPSHLSAPPCPGRAGSPSPVPLHTALTPVLLQRIY